jgi:hypothetical protein
MVKVLQRTAIALLMGLIASPVVSAADDAAFFKEKVWPIIEKSCTECHGEKKQKGKLRLDSREAWLKGGDEGIKPVPGSPEKSDVIKMIKWTYDDEDYFMPPKKEKKLSAEQVAIIEEWIKRGMPWAK